MTETREIKGKCLCGAVTVTATITKPIVRACHCDMCRRHTSSMFMSLATDPGSLRIEGPAKSFHSSDWAERGPMEVAEVLVHYLLALMDDSLPSTETKDKDDAAMADGTMGMF